MNDIDKKIYSMYFDEKKSCAEIAKILNMSTSGISKRIRTNGWPVRSRETALAMRRRANYEIIATDYKSGLSVKDIKNKHGLDECTIYYALHKYGVETNRKDNSVYDERIYKEYFENNKSLAAVAKIINIPTSSVQERFKVNGWQMRSFKKAIALVKSRCSDQEIIDRYLKSQSTIVVASEVGLSSSYVNTILRKNGIELTGNAKPYKNGGERLVSSWLSKWNISHVVNWKDWDKTKVSNRWHHIDVYVPEYKLFIEFYGINYHKNNQERDAQKKKDFLKGYPDHKWIVITDVEIQNLSLKKVAMENLKHQCSLAPLSINDLVFSSCTDINFAMHFLDRFHPLGRSVINTHVFTVSLGEIIVGVATFGSPQVVGHDYDFEFKRLALCPGLPKNTSSWFISKCVNSFSNGTRMITFIDSEHLGTSFKGANWKFLYYSSGKNSFYFKNNDDKIVGGRKALRLGKREGLTAMQWAKKYGYKKVREAPKQVFYIKVGDIIE